MLLLRRTITAAGISVASLAVGLTSVLAASPSFLSGNIMTAVDLTGGDSSWSDTVGAKPGDVVELRIVVQNQVPDTATTHTQVIVTLPMEAATILPVSAIVTADNAASVTDKVVVNTADGSARNLIYRAGHGKIYSAACPLGCTLADTITSTGVQIGSLKTGESVQLSFQAVVGNQSAVAALPVSAAPTAAPGKTAAADPPEQLPKTGLPEAVWVLSALLPAGFGLKKFAHRSPQTGAGDDPYHLSQVRQFSKKPQP